ncbi:EAL domain-containing protein [Shewanella sp. D64]|uniref:EAL domain-containing protein n=1 Tax=unclassified Shewanella TaxID=196818 RepID=UPI0022BA6ADC|nr:MULTISPECIES: EAL domain-containing protein [unclassified Shewanella]MEC4725317.1 EAL domain-containing protein [Shewanella sp. D64]MEC4735837.1 EAL domain-containing protein [Shewanella sp. E94]WBJ93192.1 EAL domain-containing protein [Shewanella sp. MTB7]
MITLDTLFLSAEYQPLINAKSLHVCGYEALSRFNDKQGISTPPNIIFEQLHEQSYLLSVIEYKAKAFQIEHSDLTLPLFLNLDPHAAEHNFDEMLILLSSRAKITVELIENTCINDAKLSSKLLSQLKAKQISVALDDIGAPHSMISLDLLSQVNTLKFDIDWFNKTSPNDLHLIKALIQFAKSSNKLCVLEGIETLKQLELARELEIDLVQGFLFKELFVTASASIALMP